MKLSKPIYALKRQAKALSALHQIPLHIALDQVAAREGFENWSLLAAHYAKLSRAGRYYARLNPGDLVLVAARPGQGKTLFALELAMEAMKAGHQAFFFTLEYTRAECMSRFEALGVDLSEWSEKFEFDGSDGICADHMIRQLEGAKKGTFAIVDYLQLLDQNRETPRLASQIQSLRKFAQEKEITMVFLSQVDRHFDAAAKPCPSLEDIRLPNPLDLSSFKHACFLHGDEIRFAMAS